MPQLPYLGFGLGLRTQHFQDILDHCPPGIDWFEVLSENFMVAGGKPKYYLHAIKERFPLVMHGVSMSIGAIDPLDWSYLRALKQLADEIGAHWLSDHLCFTGAHARNTHDLLPLPYNDCVVEHVSQRIRQVQDFLERPFLIENVSSYVSYQASELSEWDFLNAVAERANCHILLDVNNIYVSARNHDFDPKAYLFGVDPQRVQQIHLAGHTDKGSHIVDTHDHPVAEPVWQLYQQTVEYFGPVSTMIERDEQVPPLAELALELQQARRLAEATRLNLEAV